MWPQVIFPLFILQLHLIPYPPPSLGFITLAQFSCSQPLSSVSAPVPSVTPFLLLALYRPLVSLQIPDQISPTQKGFPRHFSRLPLLSHLPTLIFPAYFLHSLYHDLQVFDFICLFLSLSPRIRSSIRGGSVCGNPST